MDEARQVIGIELKKSTSAKSAPIGSGSERGHYKPKLEKPAKEEKGHYKPKLEKPAKEEKEKKSRGPSGYNLFVREQGIPFKSAGTAWKALSDLERDRWNAKAKA